MFVPLSSVNLEFGSSRSSSLATPSSTPIAVPSATRRSVAPHFSPSVTPSGALGSPLPSVSGFVHLEGEVPGRSGAVARPWSTPQPFQSVRCSRASSSSVELVQTSGSHMTPESPPLDDLAPRQAGLPSVSAGVPSPPLLRTVRSGADGGDPVPDWFGIPVDRSTPLPLEHLRFPWCRNARSRITVAELLGRRSLRPDLLRVRKVHEAERGEEASLLLARLLAEGGGAAYQIPAAIDGDRTLAYSLPEVEYVDRMTDYLLRHVPPSPLEFVLSSVTGLYVSPRPFAYSKARVALQKSACSLMRLHLVAIAPHDWAAYRHCGEADGRVFRWAIFADGLSPRSFLSLPDAVGMVFLRWGCTPYYRTP